MKEDVSYHLSRKIEVTDAEGSVTSFTLSVAKVCTDATGIITYVGVRPFEGESPNVVYHDETLILRIGVLAPWVRRQM